eukprot:8238891-Pyramimonas_sp.AAC.1
MVLLDVSNPQAVTYASASQPGGNPLLTTWPEDRTGALPSRGFATLDKRPDPFSRKTLRNSLLQDSFSNTRVDRRNFRASPFAHLSLASRPPLTRLFASRPPLIASASLTPAAGRGRRRAPDV